MRLNNIISNLSPHEMRHMYDILNFDNLSDVEIFNISSDLIEIPKENSHSYTMHAPLELLARFLLLGYVEPSARKIARLQMLATAAYYREKSESAHSCGVGDLRNNLQAARRLTLALEDGDVLAAQQAATFLSERLDGAALARLLADKFLTRLSSGGHSHIFLHLAARLPSGLSRKATRMFPGFAREAARTPELRIGLDPLKDKGKSADLNDLGGDLTGGLLHVPHLGRPSAYGIAAMVEQALAHHAPQELASLTPDRRRSRENQMLAFAVPCRIAVHSMLQESPVRAKYGWTHCLTLPQAAWGLADVTKNLKATAYVANAYVASYRAAIGEKELSAAEDVYIPTKTALRTALRQGPDEAAAAVFGLSRDAAGEAVRLLATEACIRNDCHLVKYTLACIDCMSADPEHWALYLAGAAKLAAIWIAEAPAAGLENHLHERDE